MDYKLILYILNIIFILVIIFIDNKKPEETVLWILVLNLFPVLGMLLYIFLGSTLRIRLVYLIKNNKMKNEYRSLLLKQLEDTKSIGAFIKPENLEEVEDLIRFNLNYSESVLLKHNKVDFLTSGESKYESLYRDLDNATETINILYFTIHVDSVGRKFTSHLEKAAKRGVKIKILYDAAFNMGAYRNLFKDIRKLGAEVKSIKPFITHFRNHRKIVVVDGKIGYTGGMNIGDKYIGLVKEKNPWRDTQIRIEGDSVYMLQYYFFYDWFYTAKPDEFKGLSELKDYFPKHNIKTIAPSQVISGGVDNKREYIRMSYLKLIYSAKKEIIIQSPYFVPDSSIIEALKIQAASGIKIKIMLPKVKPGYILQHATNYYLDLFKDYNIKVYLYKGYIHAKTITIDSKVTVIGTVNLDVRSLTLNDEVFVIFYDESITKRHLEIIENDKKNSEVFDFYIFDQRSFINKIIEKFIRVFAPLL